MCCFLKKKQDTNGCLSRLPNYLYRYYSLEDKYNKSRIEGCLYFSSPLNFNDLFDAQHEIVNNINDLDIDLKNVKKRLLEVGYSNPDKIIDALKKSEQAEETKMEVRKKQLEKVGICCFINDPLSILMWAYYCENKGFCIEYDMREIEKQLVKVFAKHLGKDEVNVRDRIYADSVKYQHCIPAASLFFNKKHIGKTIDKYFYKEKCWEHEHEYRIALSLGGNVLLAFNNVVKSITFGYNMSVDDIVKLLSIINNSNNAGLVLYFLKKIRGLDALERVQYVLPNTWQEDVGQIERDIRKIRNL